MTRQVFLDTETTGLEVAQGHRIIEIACVEMINRRLTRNNFHRYLNPERAIDAGAQQVHGIGSEFLADKPRFAEVADELLAYLGDAEIVIHNAPFDIGFLDGEMALLRREPFSRGRAIVDTLAMAREQFPGRKNNLDALCERFAIDNSARTLHGALLDAELLADVYLAMTRGQDSLDIGLDAARAGRGGQGAEPGRIARPAALKVRRATPAEREAHAETVADLQKASGGKAVWGLFETPGHTG